MSTFDYVSVDGTRIRGWTNDGTGPDVLLCNGLGAPLVSWPVLFDRDCGLRVVTWDYRGLGGSERPRDRSRIDVSDHVADALGALDAAGVERAVVASWSIGVNVAFELAERHPDRVSALLAVAGVPGGSFGAVTVRVAKAMRAAGPALGRFARTVPLTRATANVVRHTGFVGRRVQPERLMATLAEFRQHDFRWYFTLAVAMDEHEPMDLAFVRCPVTLVAARHDVLTSRRDVERAAARIPHARLVVLDGSHFLPLERPGEITALLRDLAS